MRIISNSANHTVKFGMAIAAHIMPGDIVCLYGELGSGKTVLTKGIAQGLGICKSKVISPSFVLMRVHDNGKIPLFHFDLYRLKCLEDILGLGFEEYLYGKGVTVIEWAGRLGVLLPREFLKVELSLKPGSKRQLKLTAFGRRHRELLEDISENISH